MKHRLDIVIAILVLASASLTHARTTPDWSGVADTIASGRLESALAQVDSILTRARAQGDASDWTRALVERRSLRSALGAPETAARELMAASWPDAPEARAILELHRADALASDFHRYGHEIRRREHTAGVDSLDLKRWGPERFGREIDRALHRAWSTRARWGDQPLADWAVYLVANSFPERIRGTLRDVVTYFRIAHLADSSLWNPRMATATARLDLASLLMPDLPRNVELAAVLADPATHPLRRIALLAADLAAWHRAHGRDGAALEAELETLRRVRQALRDEDDRVRIRQHLETRLLDLDAADAWWSLAQWQRARFLQQEKAPDHLVRAHLAASRGRDRHPESIGGQLCAAVIEEIEAPHFTLHAMTADAPGRRTIAIAQRNLGRLYLRAWRWDLAARWDQGQTRPDRAGMKAMMRDDPPDLTWTVALPATDDFAQHRTWTGLPACPPGAYVVVGSASPDFVAEAGTMQAVLVLMSDIVATAQQRAGGLDVVVRDARDGEPLEGADVDLRSHNVRHAPEPGDRLQTDAGGRARYPSDRPDRLRALVAHGEHLAVCDAIHVRSRRAETPPTRCFLYSDRSVYRPGQTVHWKLVAYRSDSQRTRFATTSGREVTVSLRDANGQVREAVTVTTNDFGSASGTFVLPAGSLLGSWRIETDPGGFSRIRVEEYRRPTFEVTLEDPAAPLRLGRPATVTGRAAYYFGEPVGEGRAVWRVRRQAHVWAGRSRFFGGGEVVASDTTAIGPDGRFTVALPTATVPRGSHADDAPRIVSYRVDVEVTDAGGETRSARRHYAVGTVSIVATIEGGRGFLVPGEVDTLTVRRIDLARVGRAGEGRWTLHALEQPARTRLPGDELRTDFTPVEALFATPGDSLRPRWQSRRFPGGPGADWPLGEAVASGRISHGEDGVARLALTAPQPGVYRLVYETEDVQGRPSRVTHRLLVAGEGHVDIREALVVAAADHVCGVGDTARFFVHSGLPDATVLVHLFVADELQEIRFLRGGSAILEVPVTADAHRGLAVHASVVQDHQYVEARRRVRVPWHEKRLQVTLGTFRDRLRPGDTETVTVTVTGPDASPAAAELLAWMVDRSLDAIAPPRRFDPLSLHTSWTSPASSRWSLDDASGFWRADQPQTRPAALPVLRASRLHPFPGSGLPYTIDAVGRLRLSGVSPELIAQLEAEGIELLPAFDVEAARYMVQVKSSGDTSHRYALDSVEDALAADAGVVMRAGQLHVRGGRSGEVVAASDVAVGADVEEALDAVAARDDFAETAFFLPHVTVDETGQATIEFQVPESVTDWRLQVAAFTRDLRAGQVEKNLRTVKDLVVRPILPRFLREGDAAELRVVISNASDATLSGHLQLRLDDPVTGADRSHEFDLQDPRQPFAVAAGGAIAATFAVQAPDGVGEVAVRAVATANGLSDGERRALPLLPGRTHLVQSRFAALQDSTRRDLRFAAMDTRDPTRRHEQLVVTVDTQLLNGMLRALPYLIEYPYECTEQTLNRYLSASILASAYADHPQVAAMASRLADRGTPLASWDAPDPNRRLRLEETPWVHQSRGAPTDRPLIALLDPAVARRQRLDALGQLRQAQHEGGGFPWFAGGQPSATMTLYVLLGLARGAEFGVEIPRDLARDAWGYVRRVVAWPGEDGAVALDPGTITLLNYVLSCYADDDDDGSGEVAGYPATARAAMLDLSWQHRLTLPRMLRACLALTLERAGRHDDARAVIAALLDVARRDPDLGVFWAPEDRAWLWTNDTVEGHAFVLRAVSEIAPDHPDLAGLAQWLLLNRKLDHWKSTRATAEAIHALVHYQRATGTLAIREAVRVQVGDHDRRFVSDPADPTAGRDRLVLTGAEIPRDGLRPITISKTTPGLAFASATWHFSTARPDPAADGDLFVVTRRYHRRHHDGERWVLMPLTGGETLAVGDQIEVHLDITARHAAEYVHLRDPRPAGWEPEAMTSAHRWRLGLRYFQEIRDSGANFFFAWLPAGQHTLKHRLRAATAGTFRAQPTVLQSMYAPEFAAHSAGTTVRVVPEAE